MARIIQCDRCEAKIKDEAHIYTLAFSPMPKTTANTTHKKELCENCFDQCDEFARRKPDRWKQVGDKEATE